MATDRRFQNGVLREQWTNATQPTDPALAGYTAWDVQGANPTTRALTADEIAMLSAHDLSSAQLINQSVIQQLVAVALPANRTDQTQDATIQSGAATITGTSGALSTAQLSNFVRQLAQAVSTLAANDVNAKKELNLLIRLALQQFDGTA